MGIFVCIFDNLWYNVLPGIALQTTPFRFPTSDLNRIINPQPGGNTSKGFKIITLFKLQSGLTGIEG